MIAYWIKKHFLLFFGIEVVSVAVTHSYSHITQSLPIGVIITIICMHYIIDAIWWLFTCKMPFNWAQFIIFAFESSRSGSSSLLQFIGVCSQHGRGFQRKRNGRNEYVCWNLKAKMCSHKISRIQARARTHCNHLHLPASNFLLFFSGLPYVILVFSLSSQFLNKKSLLSIFKANKHTKKKKKEIKQSMFGACERQLNAKSAIGMKPMKRKQFEFLSSSSHLISPPNMCVWQNFLLYLSPFFSIEHQKK